MKLRDVLNAREGIKPSDKIRIEVSYVYDSEKDSPRPFLTKTFKNVYDPKLYKFLETWGNTKVTETVLDLLNKEALIRVQA